MPPSAANQSLSHSPRDRQIIRAGFKGGPDPSTKPRDLLVLRYGAPGEFTIRRFKDMNSHDFEGVPRTAPVYHAVAMASLMAVEDRVDLWYSEDDRSFLRLAICRSK